MENIIVDKTMIVPTIRIKKNNMNTPMEIGMTTKEDGQNASQICKSSKKELVNERQEKEDKGDIRTCWTCDKTRQLQESVRH